MRTTLTLDDDLADFLKIQSRLQGRPFNQVVNDALRRGIAPASQGSELPTFRVLPNRSAILRASIRSDSTNSMMSSKRRISPGRAGGDRARRLPAGLRLQRRKWSLHEAARHWWESLIIGKARVGFPWAVSTGFARLITHPQVLTSPVSPSDAMTYAGDRFLRPHVTPINPRSEHLKQL